MTEQQEFEALLKSIRGKRVPKPFTIIKYKNGNVLDLSAKDFTKEQLRAILKAIPNHAGILSVKLSENSQYQLLELFGINISRTTKDLERATWNGTYLDAHKTFTRATNAKKINAEYFQEGILKAGVFNRVKNLLLPEKLYDCIKEGRLRDVPHPFTFKKTSRGGVLDLSKKKLKLKHLKKIAEAIPKNTDITCVKIVVASFDDTPAEIAEIEKLLKAKGIRLERRMKTQSLVVGRGYGQSDTEQNSEMEANMGGQNLTALYRAETPGKETKAASTLNITKSRTAPAQKPKSILRDKDNRRSKTGFYL